MAVVAVQQFVCFADSNWRNIARPCIPSHTTILLHSRKKIQFSLISCSSSQTPEVGTQTAESCVNLGLELFSKGRVSLLSSIFSSTLLILQQQNRVVLSGTLKALCFFLIDFLQVKDALTQFETALSLNPNPVEAQAAYYNKACCHAYRYNIFLNRITQFLVGNQ